MDAQALLEAFRLFLEDNDIIISALGAAAWAPALMDLFLKAKEAKDILERKIEMSVIDTIIKKIKDYPDGVLLLAANIYIPEKSFFCKNIKAVITLGNDEKITTEIIGKRTLYESDNSNCYVKIPNEYNFHLHREILCNKDNIRIIALPLRGMNTTEPKDIKKIKFIFEGDESTKSTKIYSDELKFCNNSTFLNEIMGMNSPDHIMR